VHYLKGLVQKNFWLFVGRSERRSGGFKNGVGDGLLLFLPLNLPPDCYKPSFCGLHFRFRGKETDPQSDEED
jgi:hypothetical protein